MFHQKRYGCFLNKALAFCVVFTAFFALISLSVSSGQAQEVAEAAAGDGAGDEAVIYAPTSAWLVGLSRVAADDSGVPYPCVMATQYSNGYFFRFSGDDKKIMTMAIDFRQAVFEPGERYLMNLSFVNAAGDAAMSFEGTAYDSGTLIVSFLSTDKGDHTATDLYKRLKQGGVLSVNLGAQVFPFALLGLSDGLARMGRCYREQGRMGPVAAGEKSAQ